MTSDELFEMSQIDITMVDPSSLVDIESVVIDHTLPHEEKILSYIKQMGNPYCFKSSGIPVRVCFSSDGKDLSQSLIDFFTRLKAR